jgi:hypothetical protein
VTPVHSRAEGFSRYIEMALAIPTVMVRIVAEKILIHTVLIIQSLLNIRVHRVLGSFVLWGSMTMMIKTWVGGNNGQQYLNLKGITQHRRYMQRFIPTTQITTCKMYSNGIS